MFVERAVELLRRAFKRCSLSLLRLDNHCVRGASILNCLMQHFQFLTTVLSDSPFVRQLSLWPLVFKHSSPLRSILLS